MKYFFQIFDQITFSQYYIKFKMDSQPKLLLREIISSAIVGIFLYGYCQEPDYIRCICFTPLAIMSLSRIILQLMGQLRTDIYCGLTEKWMLSAMNVPCIFFVCTMFAVDFVIAYKDSISPPVLLTLKAYVTLNYIMYARFYFGFFNLELQFPFIILIIEASIMGLTWNFTPDQSLKTKMLLITVAMLIYQIVIYVIILPKQTKNIVPLLDLPYREHEQAQARMGAQTPQSKKQPSTSTNKKSQNKKKD